MTVGSVAQTVKEPSRLSLRRLNVLLRFARVDPWTLSNGALARLLDEMCFAVLGDPRRADVQYMRLWFDRLATREALSEAQRGLDHALQILFKPTGQVQHVKFKLERQALNIAAMREARVVSGKPERTIRTIRDQFRISQSWSRHFPTVVYTTFAEVLKASGVKPSDFLHCSYCNSLFVPLRKPRKGTPVYCSHNCASVIASRNYRARQAAVRVKEKKVQSVKKKRKPK